MPRDRRVCGRACDWKIGICVASVGLLAGGLLSGGDPPAVLSGDFSGDSLELVRSGRTGAPALPPKRGFAPDQAAGPPDVRQAGDNGQAWASQTPDGQR